MRIMFQPATQSGSPLEARHTAWITSVTKVVCSIPTFYILHRFNRRVLFLGTGLLIVTSFAALAVFTLADDQGWVSEELTNTINFIPMVCVILAYVGMGLGYAVIPSLIAAEAMPVDVRSFAIGLFMTVEMSSTFLSSKLKPVLMKNIKLYGLFALFSCKVIDLKK